MFEAGKAIAEDQMSPNMLAQTSLIKIYVNEHRRMQQRIKKSHDKQPNTPEEFLAEWIKICIAVTPGINPLGMPSKENCKLENQEMWTTRSRCINIAYHEINSDGVLDCSGPHRWSLPDIYMMTTLF